MTQRHGDQHRCCGRLGEWQGTALAWRNNWCQRKCCADMAIRGHVFCSFLALLLAKELEDRLHWHNIAAEWDDILRDLDRLQEIELEQDGKRFLLRTPTTGVAGKLFQAVGVALPPNIQELPLTTPQPAA